ncbi:MAG TPA: hypothetical protein VNM90_15065 [Haliangium sp.]|nr:hypothetical protein [Haliangium sp.]
MSESLDSRMPSIPGPSTPHVTTGRLILSGLLAGLVVNLIDVPNSAIFVSPGWTRFLAEHGITMNVPLVSTFYVLLHFAYGIAIVFTYGVFRRHFGAGPRTALRATLLLLGLHRAFGLGMVVMGTMPFPIYLQFSTSMLIGSILGGLLGARVHDRTRG